MKFKEELESDIEYYRYNMIIVGGMLTTLIIMFSMVLISDHPIEPIAWWCCVPSMIIQCGLLIYYITQLNECTSELDDLEMAAIIKDFVETSEKEIKMDNIIPELIKEAFEIREQIIIKNVCDDIEEHPEFYGDVKKYEITREQILDTLNKGAMYDNLEKKYEDLKNDLQNEASNAEFYKSERDNLEDTLQELREACDNFICEFDSQDHIMFGYNLPYETRYSIIKQLIKEFEDEINGEGC